MPRITWRCLWESGKTSGRDARALASMRWDSVYVDLMVDERIDAKLTELTRELKSRALFPGCRIADAFALRGLDEGGRAGLFAAVLLPAEPAVPELDTLTLIRQALTARLKQLHSNMPAWPIIVQGAPEVISGYSVVPGGPEYFAQLRSELQVRRAPPTQASTMPVAELSTQLATTLMKPAHVARAARDKATKSGSSSATRGARARRA